MILKNEMSRYSVRRTLSLTEEVSRDLDLYAQAIDSSANWVINQVLSRFFSKDKDFLEWKETLADEPGEKKVSSHKSSKRSTKEKESSITSA